MNRNVKKIVLSGLIAAMYVVLTLLQNALLPGTTSAAVQFRASEALCVLALFTPAAVPGLTVGCIISNIFCGARGNRLDCRSARLFPCDSFYVFAEKKEGGEAADFISCLSGPF